MYSHHACRPRSHSLFLGCQVMYQSHLPRLELTCFSVTEIPTAIKFLAGSVCDKTLAMTQSRVQDTPTRQPSRIFDKCVVQSVNVARGVACDMFLPANAKIGGVPKNVPQQRMKFKKCRCRSLFPLVWLLITCHNLAATPADGALIPFQLRSVQNLPGHTVRL